MKYINYFFLTFLFPLLAFAQPGETDCPPGKLCNPLKGTDVDTLGEFLRIVLDNIVLPIGSIIVVLAIIYTGFLFVTARGNEAQLETAKKSLLYVVIGAAILLGSVAISALIGGTICEIAPGLPDCPNIVRNP